MTDDTANLVLEQLRKLRLDIASIQEELSGVRRDVGEFRETMDAQMQGLIYIVTSAVGSMTVDMKDMRARIARLENAAHQQ